MNDIDQNNDSGPGGPFSSVGRGRKVASRLGIELGRGDGVRPALEERPPLAGLPARPEPVDPPEGVVDDFPGADEPRSHPGEERGAERRARGHRGPEDLHPQEIGLELEEEVVIDTPYRQRCVGLINDDRTPVGSVHLGVVHVFDVERPAVRPREADLLESGFEPVDRLLADVSGFETWSQICLRALFHRRPVLGRAAGRMNFSAPSRHRIAVACRVVAVPDLRWHFALRQ